MIILPNNIAIASREDQLSKWVEEWGHLDNKSDAALQENLKYIKPGDWVVDAGAALGDHTIAYLEAVGGTGRVLAFEPNPHYWECLNHNCLYALLYRYALSDKEGMTQLKFSPESLGESMLGDEGVFIYATRLDLMGLTRLDLYKLDIEGHELEALQGSEDTVKRCQPVIQLEWNPEKMSAEKIKDQGCVRWLENMGYKWKAFGGVFPERCEIIAVPKGREFIG